MADVALEAAQPALFLLPGEARKPPGSKGPGYGGLRGPRGAGGEGQTPMAVLRDSPSPLGGRCREPPTSLAVRNRKARPSLLEAGRELRGGRVKAAGRVGGAKFSRTANRGKLWETTPFNSNHFLNFFQKTFVISLSPWSPFSPF